MPDPKKIVYEKIARELPDPHGGAGTILHPIYAMMERIKVNYHLPHLADCNIVLMWHKAWKPDRDKHLTLGQAIRIDDRTRQLCEWDAEIVLNYDWWNNQAVTDSQREALMDHELCHIRPVLEDKDDPNSLPRRDENGRNVYYIRKHTVEDFHEIFQRHGTWKEDLEAMARILIAQNPPTTTTVDEDTDEDDGVDTNP